jgi:lipopolysaccharide/colanic/teichoic acid biosynthesis glycosyltransferase
MGFSKRCTKCNRDKWWYEFYKDKDKQFGLKATCKECFKKRQLKYIQENKMEYNFARRNNMSITRARKYFRHTTVVELLELAEQIDWQ